jgi:ribonuclease P protein component
MNAATSGGRCSGPDAGFPRSLRLTAAGDFKRVFHQPLVSADRYFKVLAKPGRGDCWRLGMAVSRQVDKRATARNRIKRIVRESFRQRSRRAAGNAPVLDVVILPRRGIASISNDSLRGSLDAHWARLEAKARDAVVHAEPSGDENRRSSNPLNS